MSTHRLLKLVFRFATALALVAAVIVAPMRSGGRLFPGKQQSHRALPAKNLARVSVSSLPSTAVRIKAVTSEKEEEHSGTISPHFCFSEVALTPSSRPDWHLEKSGLRRECFPLRC